MSLFSSAGELIADRLAPEVLRALVEATQFAVAPETRAAKCKPGHLLLALWPTLGDKPAWRRALEAACAREARLDDIRRLIAGYVRDAAAEPVFTLRRDDFERDALRAIETCERLENDLGDVLWQADGRPIELLPFWVSVLQNAGEEDRRGVGRLFDFERAAASLCRLLAPARGAGEPAEEPAGPAVVSPEGALRVDMFDEAALDLVHVALALAGELGYDRLRPPHLVLALLDSEEGLLADLLRLRLAPGVTTAMAREALLRALDRRTAGEPTRLSPRQEHLSDTCARLFAEAAGAAQRAGLTAIDEGHLLRAALAAEREGVSARCLTGDALGLNWDFLLRDVDRRLAAARLGEARRLAAPFAPRVANLAVEDLTSAARKGLTPPTVGQDALIQQCLQGLFKRRERHLLITGEPGVGKTALVRELARRAALEPIDFLKNRRFVWVDCESVSAVNGRQTWFDLLAAVEGRRDVILCLDHFERLLRNEGQREADNRGLVRVALRENRAQLVAVLENRHFAELLSADHALLDLFTRVDVPEPSVEQTRVLLETNLAPRLARAYRTRVAPAACARAVHATKEFLLSQRLPQKAIRALVDACERVAFARAQATPDGAALAETEVTDADVIAVVAERAGVDAATVSASGSGLDFAAELGKQVVGQSAAVRVVADRLTRVKAGATRAGRPAAVMLFAGLTGSGKTELAKAVARLYSASRKLTVYPMSNFPEAHSISALTGVPPGYVGHEAGGRLINDLNADPHGVVLFDEAEKAHPDVWQSMLSLFDEAWIEDRRGVRAYGNRAIFILTANAEQEFIRDHHAALDPETLKDEVARRLVDYRHPQSGLRPFPPEFLARFTDIVVFSPLTLAAFRGVAQLQAAALADDWRRKHGQEVAFAESALQRVAEWAFRENEAHRGARGARLVQKLLGDRVELELINHLVRQPALMEDVLRFDVEPDDEAGLRVAPAELVSRTPEQAAAAAERRWTEWLPPNAHTVAAELERHAGQTLADWRRRAGGAAAPVAEELERAAAAALASVRLRCDQLTAAVEAARGELILAMRRARDASPRQPPTP